MMMLLISAFAVVRISQILVEERGPWDVFYWLREKIGIRHDADMRPAIIPEKFISLLFSCVQCMSVWVGLVIYLLYIFLPQQYFLLLVVPFALSGAAVLIDSHTYKG